MTPTQTDTLLNALTEVREDIGRRLKGVTDQITALDCKVDVIDGRIGALETDRAVVAAVAATKAAMLAEQRISDQQRENSSESHVLTDLQRKGLYVAAFGGVAGVIDILAHIAGVWR